MSLVRKILEATIPSGGSSATFTDSDIPNSLIRVYSTNSNIYPQNISLTGNTLTVTYEVVSSALGVAVELVKQGLEIDDNLTSDNTDHALSAKQGKVLKGLIDGLDIPDNISEMQDVDITDIEDEQVLAWDETAQKFVNVDQSGGSSINYSTTEHVIGTWYDGSILYEKTKVIPFSSFTSIQGGTRYVYGYVGSGENVKYIEGFMHSSYGICFLGSRNYEADNTYTNYYWEFNNYYANINVTFVGNPVSEINPDYAYITYRYTKS